MIKKTLILLQDLTFHNPVAWKELRLLTHGKRMVGFLAGYLCLMAFSLVAAFLIKASPTLEPYGWLVGRMAFMILTALQLLFLSGIAPPFCAGLISGERELKTFDHLLLTSLTPSRIIMGKFLSTMSFLGLAILATLPLYLWGFSLLGGVTLGDIMSGTLQLFVYTAMVTAIGLLGSAMYAKTSKALFFSYRMFFLMTVLTIISSHTMKNLIGVLISSTNSSHVTPPLIQFDVALNIPFLLAITILCLTSVTQLIQPWHLRQYGWLNMQFIGLTLWGSWGIPHLSYFLAGPVTQASRLDQEAVYFTFFLIILLGLLGLSVFFCLTRPKEGPMVFPPGWRGALLKLTSGRGWTGAFLLVFLTTASLFILGLFHQTAPLHKSYGLLRACQSYLTLLATLLGVVSAGLALQVSTHAISRRRLYLALGIGYVLVASPLLAALVEISYSWKSLILGFPIWMGLALNPFFGLASLSPNIGVMEFTLDVLKKPPISLWQVNLIALLSTGIIGLWYVRRNASALTLTSPLDFETAEIDD